MDQCLYVVLAVLFLVIFLRTIDYESCATMLREPISYEQGVKDLKVNVPDKTVTITFDSAKTDTLKLGKAINKLGYTAKVVEYKQVKK